MTERRAAEELATVRDWVRWSATRLGRGELHYGHGTDSPWDDAVALVGGWLRIPPDRLGPGFIRPPANPGGAQRITAVQNPHFIAK
jgi:ribosomal protein L3 glutamine methyltransferase